MGVGIRHSGRVSVPEVDAQPKPPLSSFARLAEGEQAIYVEYATADVAR